MADAQEELVTIQRQAHLGTSGGTCYSFGNAYCCFPAAGTSSYSTLYQWAFPVATVWSHCFALWSLVLQIAWNEGHVVTGVPQYEFTRQKTLSGRNVQMRFGNVHVFFFNFLTDFVLNILLVFFNFIFWTGRHCSLTVQVGVH